MKQEMKFAARVLENLPPMSAEVMQGWIDNPLALQEFLTGLRPAGEWSAPKPKPKPKRNRYLNRTGSATVAPTKGDVTIANASDVFGYIDPDYKKWGTDIAGVDTAEQVVDLYEVKKDGTYAQLFGSLSKNHRSLCHSQGQIVEFCRTNRHLLRQDGYGTFFLFEVNGEVFVALVLVRVGGGELGVNLGRFSNHYVWDATIRRRLVVPQQTV